MDAYTLTVGEASPDSQLEGNLRGGFPGWRLFRRRTSLRQQITLLREREGQLGVWCSGERFISRVACGPHWGVLHCAGGSENPRLWATDSSWEISRGVKLVQRQSGARSSGEQGAEGVTEVFGQSALSAFDSTE